MTFLIGLLTPIVEWLLTQLFAVVGKDFVDWQTTRKANSALADNEAKLQAAKQSGDQNAIVQQGTASLDNDGGN